MSSPRVGYSRVITAPTMVVVGTSVAVAIGAFVVLGYGLEISGEDTPITIALSTILFLPVVLCIAARVSESWRGGTAYAVMRRDGSPPLLFATGWLCIAGYLTVSALMAETIAYRIDLALERFFGVDFPRITVVAPIVALAVLKEMLLPSQSWRGRGLLWVVLTVLAGGLAVVLALSWETSARAHLPAHRVDHWLAGTAIVAAALWFMEIVLDDRRQFRRSDRTLSRVLIISWLIAGGFAILGAFVIIRHPDLFLRVEGMTRASWDRGAVKLLALFLAVALCGTTLNRMFGRSLRLISAMTRDGFLPGRLDAHTDEDRSVSPLLFLLVAAAVTALAAGVKFETLVGMAAVTFLWVALLVIVPGLARGKKAGARLLPLHPLFPLTAIAVSGFCSLILPLPTLPIAAAWLLAGGVVYRVFRRRTELGTEQGSPEDETPLPDPTEGTFRVLVCVGPAGDFRPLLRVGSALARAADGEFIALRVIPLFEQLPRTEIERKAKRIWRALEDLVDKVDDEHGYALVRIAPTTKAGILDAAKNHRADIILLEWPPADRVRRAEEDGVVQRVFSESPQAVVVVRGRLSEEAGSALAAVSDSPDARLVFEVGAALAEKGEFKALHVHPASYSDVTARERLGELLGDPERAARLTFVESEDPERTILTEAAESAVLVLGTSRDRDAERRGIEGMWADLAREYQGPILLARCAEPHRLRPLFRLARLASEALPTLSISERAEVYAQMRHAARASVDFYVLIVIASAIAILGLYLDSAAVIIGAMLVAPLMSPILSIAQGSVQGNLVMVRRGIASTLKGAMVSIGVALLFSLIAADIMPTGEILARTKPTMLDLFVGLAAGAAAAYAVSRKSVAAALPGVAISVALVPPLCVVGFGLGTDRFDVAFGALILFLTNLCAIVLVSVFTFLLLGFYPRVAEKRVNVRRAVALGVVGLVLLSIPLGSASEEFRVRRLEEQVAKAFREEAQEENYRLQDVSVKREGDVYFIRARVYSSGEISQESLVRLKEECEAEAGVSVRIELAVIRADILTTE